MWLLVFCASLQQEDVGVSVPGTRVSPHVGACTIARAQTCTCAHASLTKQCCAHTQRHMFFELLLSIKPCLFFALTVSKGKSVGLVRHQAHAAGASALLPDREWQGPPQRAWRALILIWRTHKQVRRSARRQPWKSCMLPSRECTGRIFCTYYRVRKEPLVFEQSRHLMLYAVIQNTARVRRCRACLETSRQLMESRICWAHFLFGGLARPMGLLAEEDQEEAVDVCMRLLRILHSGRAAPTDTGAASNNTDSLSLAVAALQLLARLTKRHKLALKVCLLQLSGEINQRILLQRRCHLFQ